MTYLKNVNDGQYELAKFLIDNKIHGVDLSWVKWIAPLTALFQSFIYFCLKEDPESDQTSAFLDALRVR